MLARRTLDLRIRLDRVGTAIPLRVKNWQPDRWKRSRSEFPEEDARRLSFISFKPSEFPV